MPLKASRRPEAPPRPLEQLRRIQHQTAQTGEGQLLRGLGKLGTVQRELVAAIRVPVPTPGSVLPSTPEPTVAENL
jgi:hypothetical protein